MVNDVIGKYGNPGYVYMRLKNAMRNTENERKVPGVRPEVKGGKECITPYWIPLLMP